MYPTGISVRQGRSSVADSLLLRIVTLPWVRSASRAARLPMVTPSGPSGSTRSPSAASASIRVRTRAIQILSREGSVPFPGVPRPARDFRPLDLGRQLGFDRGKVEGLRGGP